MVHSNLFSSIHIESFPIVKLLASLVLCSPPMSIHSVTSLIVVFEDASERKISLSCFEEVAQRMKPPSQDVKP